MKTYLRICITGMTVLSVMSCLLGCHTSKKADAGSAPATTQEASVTPTKTPLPEEADSLSLTITVINHCKVDIGMFSVIDPRNGEQIDLGAIAADEALTTSANWPKDSTTLQWALYNQNGDLSVESSTDISAATKSVTLTLIGDGDLTDVEEAFE